LLSGVAAAGLETERVTEDAPKTDRATGVGLADDDDTPVLVPACKMIVDTEVEVEVEAEAEAVDRNVIDCELVNPAKPPFASDCTADEDAEEDEATLERMLEASAGAIVDVVESRVVLAPGFSEKVDVEFESLPLSSQSPSPVELEPFKVVPLTPQAEKIDNAVASLVQRISVPLEPTDGNAKHCCCAGHLFTAVNVDVVEQNAISLLTQAISPG